MSSTDIIEIIGIVISLFFGICSFIYSRKSNKISCEANILSKQSNDIANKSLKLSEEIKKDQDESIKINNYTSLEIIKNTNIKYIGEESYDEYLLLIPVEINNISSNPVTIKRPYFWEGNDGEYIYISDDEFFKIEGYAVDYQFPLYLKPKESKHIDIIIGLNSADRMKFHANKGVTLTFEGTKKNYKKYFSNRSVIDNN